MVSQFEAFELRTQHFLIRMFESLATQLKERLHPSGPVPLYRNPRRLPVHPQVKRALQVVVRRRFESFTSPEQAQLVDSVRSNLHVVGILETGGGKSMSFFGATKLFPGRLVLVITPLVALTEDLRHKLWEQGIKGGVWGDKGLDPNTGEVILVSAHIAGKDEFFNWVNAPAIRQRLLRIFIDECHKILTDECFRPCFRLFHRLTSVGVPITFLSATLMPRAIPFLLERMQIRDPSLVDEIRRYTGRKNLKYLIEKADDSNQILPKIRNLVMAKETQLEGKERGIIFCQRISDVEELQEQLKSPMYHGRLEDGDKLKATQIWKEGKTIADRWMISTQAFGQGVDHSHVRYTIHKDPWELINWAQETGRAGRDRSTAVCYTYWSSLPPPLAASDPDFCGREEMRRLLPSSECLRLGFACLDHETWSCTALDGQLCSNCEQEAQVG